MAKGSDFRGAPPRSRFLHPVLRGLHELGVPQRIGTCQTSTVCPTAVFSWWRVCRSAAESARVRGMLRAAIFDFHNTLVMGASLSAWLADAGADSVTATRVLPVLTQVWSRAGQRFPGASWDLDPALHHQAFTQVLVEDAACPAELAERLYASMPAQWIPAPGALELLKDLHCRGVRTGLLSNIAVDPRSKLDEIGLLQYLDVVMLSFEEGLVKPNPEIFTRMLDRLGVKAHECLMVGDSPSVDGGSTDAGIASLIIPQSRTGPDLSLAACFFTR